MIPVFVVDYRISEGKPVSKLWNAFVESLKKYTWIKYLPKNRKIEQLKLDLERAEAEYRELDRKYVFYFQAYTELQYDYEKLADDYQKLEARFNRLCSGLAKLQADA